MTTHFSPKDLKAIDRLWRAVPSDHVWTGWSALGDTPEEVIIYRTRAHWRKFPLRKSRNGFTLHNEQGTPLASAPTLKGILKRVDALPGLNESNAT